ncbi:tetratricopeptide repeat protein [Chlamydiifrater phoenicopteri]|uniref:tetratricopeptide repeat protein n=1 Tax=Chlamydiifrater phoenicopteri TaxID=2681469 RepID=UPI001BCEF1F7|nr:tetratricopeptide repeat protein [Chlamydiifrater phoenicopteri]
MWIMVSWTLVGGLVLALLAKAYSRVVTFRKYAVRAIKEIRFCIGIKDWGVAEQKLLPLLKKRRFRRQYLIDYVRILRETGRFREVDAYLDQIQRFDAKDFRYYLELGYRDYRKGSYKTAAQLFSKIRKENLEEQDVAKYASALVHLGELDLACNLIEPLVSPLSPQETFIALGHIYFASKRYEDAAEFYSRAYSLGYCSSDIIYKFAQASRLISDYEKAKILFRSLLKEAFYRDEALFNIGLCEQKMGRQQQALLIYQSSPLWKRGDALLMRHAAAAAMAVKNYPLSESCWKLALKCPTYSGNPDCCFDYGLSLCRQRKFGEAETMFLKAVALFPEHLGALKALAWLSGIGLATLVAPEEGLAFARKAVGVTRNTETLELLSACEARSGCFDVAYEIQTFLSNSDSSQESRRRRSQILRNLRRKLPLNNQLISEFSELLAA